MHTLTTEKAKHNNIMTTHTSICVPHQTYVLHVSYIRCACLWYTYVCFERSLKLEPERKGKKGKPLHASYSQRFGGELPAPLEEGTRPPRVTMGCTMVFILSLELKGVLPIRLKKEKNLPYPSSGFHAQPASPRQVSPDCGMWITLLAANTHSAGFALA